MSELCIKCGKRGDKKCGRCKRVTYCSAQCQTDHWKAGHKGECKLLSDTSASAYIAPATTAASPATAASAAAAKSAPASSSSASVSTPSTPPSTWQANERPRPAVEDFLFPPKRVQQMMSFQSREHELIGSTLTNVGNSCFVNAVMQCITYTRPLTTAFLMHDEHDKACKKGERGDYCLWCILQQHVREALDPKGYVQITPRELLLSLPRIGQFRLGVQEDAHEFFLAVLSELQNSIISTMPKKPHPSLEDTTLLYQVFGGSMQSQVRCKQCGSVSCRYEPFLDLNLELSSGNSIEEALSSYTSIEELGKDVGWKCEKCNQVAAAQKQLTIYDCPNILSIQLKRFDLLQGGVKSHKSVVFREDLDLRRVVSFNRQHQDTSYELYAIVVHYGQTMHVGHYVAFVKIGNKWHLFDDAKMQEVNPAVVLQQSAYMLFYRKLYILTPEEIDRRKREEAEKERQQKAAAAPKKKKALKHSTGELLPPPPHRIFYHLSADNAMSAFTVRVDLPPGFLPDKANLTVSESGSLALSTPQCPSLSLSLPMPLSVSRASARFYTKDSVLAVELPVESEAERAEREKREATPSASPAAPPATIVTSEKSAKSEESVQKKKTPLSSSSTDLEVADATGHPIAIAVHDGPAQLNIDPENELEIARPSSPAPPSSPQHADSTVSGSGGVGAGEEGSKGGAKKAPAPSAENKEKATYHKLYQDLRNGPSAATSATAPSEAKQKKAGRNDPCPCGSGKKYKNCHG